MRTSEVFVTACGENLYRLCVDGAFYAWSTTNPFLPSILADNNLFAVTILRNMDGKAMLNVKDTLDGTIRLRQEINPWELRDSPDWEVDTNSPPN